MELAKKVVIKTGEEAYTSRAGLKATQISLSVEGDKALVWVPEVVKARTKITLVIHCHGYTGNERDLLTEQGDPLSHHLERGWVVVAGYNLGNSGWGRKEVMELIRGQYDWVATRYTVENVLLTGGSMGGFTALNVYQNDVMPNIRAAAVIVSVINLTAMEEGGYPVLSSWGVATIAELEAKQKAQGLDPLRDDPQKMAGKPLFLHQDSTDPLVIKALHGDIFRARAATPEAIEYLETSSTKHAYPFNDPAKYPAPKPDMAFLRRFAPVYDATQDPATSPPPSPDTAEQAAATVFLPDGRPVDVFDVQGRRLIITTP